MIRKRLLATVAAPPLLLLFSGQALAETEISNSRTTPVRTSTVASGGADDVLINDDGSIELTTAEPGVTVDSNNTVVNEGEIATEDVDGSVGILIKGGVTTDVTNTGVINILDSFDETDDDNDTDDDGDLDGAFATGTRRYGIRVTGSGTVTGTILNDVGGGIYVEGNDSYGVSLESPLTGDLINRGVISVLGDNDFGMRAATPVTGMVEASGSIQVQGANAVGLAVDADVTGYLHLQGGIVVTGYRYTSRSSDDDALAALDEDDLLQGGPAVRVTANVTGGILLDASATSTSDFDGDGILDVYDDDDDNDGILDADDPDDNNDGITDNDYDDDGKTNANDSDDDNDGIADDDDDDDNGDGIPDDDLDQDGRADASEGTASLAVYGSAPALLIGSDVNTVTIGAVGTGDEAYGLIVRGSISASGVFDNVSATAVQIGGDAGYATIIDGGILQDGSIAASAYNADATGVRLTSGASVETLINNGTIYSSLVASSAPLSDEGSFTATALDLAAGARLDSLSNAGSIIAVAGGENSDAVAIIDRSGTLGRIENSGSIQATIYATDDENDTDDDNEDADDEVIQGKAIALDLRANTAGVNILQYSLAPDRDSDGVPDAIDADDDNDGVLDVDDDDADNDGIKDSKDDDDAYDSDGDGVVDSQEPSIIGDVLLGSGDDVLDIRNGSLTGAVSFGDGADSLILGSADGLAQMTGDLTDSDGRLTIDLVRGELTVTNAETIAASSITISGASTLTITADPAAGGNTRFEVATASLESGARLGLQLDDLIDGPQRYTIIHATDPGGLTVSGLVSSLDEYSPYLFVVTAAADTQAGDVYLDVRRRTAEEMALGENESRVLDAVYAALGNDETIRDVFLSAETRDDFLGLYRQMIPDQGEGVFSSLDLLSRTVSRLTATRPDLRERYGPDSFWIQEINTGVVREAGLSAGSETKAFGFVAGYESMGADGGALGTTLSFITADERDDAAQVGEQTSISLVEAGVYWRRSIGGLSFNMRGAAGYAWLEGSRVFIDPATALVVEADSGWNGYTGSASANVAYEARAGRFYARPSLGLDYLYFHEGERVESGGSAFDQRVQDRTSSRLSAAAEIAVGATFGRDTWWRPELRLGYRQHLSGTVGDTVFRFSGGQWVSLPASDPGDGAAIVGLSIKSGSPTSYIALEGEYEAADGEDRYNVMLAGRMIF
ncbi:MAG: autotransporter outer membrane beta-barrel domain-containing protein [Caulobacter sp.]|nr:autotransporter outer membrane beta-barrel domain-containing protein [Caulobacter sp.]